MGMSNWVLELRAMPEYEAGRDAQNRTPHWPHNPYPPGPKRDAYALGIYDVRYESQDDSQGDDDNGR